MDTVNIAGLDKADVLAALYNAAKPQGLGFLHYEPTPMTRDQAAALLEHDDEFDYLKGRVMKVRIASDEIGVWAYDRDNGAGAAQLVIDALRLTAQTNAPEIRDHHAAATQAAARDTKAMIQTDSHWDVEGGIPVLHLGLSDVAGELAPAVDAALTGRLEKSS